MNWMRWRFVYYTISLTLLILAAVPLALGKLEASIEFVGGSRLVFATQTDIPTEQVTNLSNTYLEEQGIESEPLKPRSNQEFELFTTTIDNQSKEAYLQHLQTELDTTVQEVEFQTVGPSLGQELITKTIFAIVLGTAAILVYLWWQFRRWNFGLAGILAMLHDTFILLGSFAWLSWFSDARVDVLFVTAVLTTLSFSVHDTIVVFDRVRELSRTLRGAQPEELANLALTQTLTRSLNNSLTILFMLAALILLGGESLHWFAVALFIGTLTGTYSSTFVALPLYVDSFRLRRNA